jgi:hypothetical protein
MAFNEGRYTSVAPVFLSGVFEAGAQTGEETAEAAFGAALTAARRVSHALLFTQWAALPDPGHSARYLRQPGAGGWARAFGANERELLLIEYPPYSTIPSADASSFSRMVERFAAVNTGDQTPELLRLIETVRLGMRPDRDLLGLVIDFVAAHEDIFNRAGDRPLGRAFGRRLAAFFCKDFDRLADWREAFELMYDIRSGVLHGRDPTVQLEALTLRFSQPQRFLLHACYSTCSLLAGVIAAYGTVDGGFGLLREGLDRASHDRSAYEAARAELDRDWLRS